MKLITLIYSTKVLPTILIYNLYEKSKFST